MSGRSFDELDDLLEPLDNLPSPRLVRTDVEPAQVPSGLPMTLAERVDEEPNGDRSRQHYALVAAAVDAGYSDEQVVAMVLAHRPSVDKYADPQGEALRSLAKLRVDARPAVVHPISTEGPPAIDQLVDSLRSYLHLDDTAHVLFAVATAVSARMETGEPLWGMIVGSPSSGKTEMVRALDDVADQHPDEITAPSLLSWSKGKDPKAVGVLPRMPSPGFLTVADFSTVLATSDRGGRDQLFALLRRAFDGHVSRDLGNTPNTLTWAGRVTILSAVTPMIDNFSSHNDALGPRWLYCRVASQDVKTKRSTGRRSLHAGELQKYRSEARRIASSVVASATKRLPDIELSDEAVDFLVDCAIVACYGRAGVERNGYGRREILGMPIVEEPPRVTSQLGLLCRSLMAMGLDESAALALCRRCAMDSMPPDRWAVLEALAAEGTSTVSAVARRAGCHRHVARFALEDLSTVGIVEWGGADDAESDGDDAFRPRPWSLTGGDSEVVERVVKAETTARESAALA